MPPEVPPVASAPADRRLVLVAGTGRSGTSTLAGVLRRLGLHVPQPEVGSDDTNPRGFGEPQWVVDFHDRLLHQANVQVSDARPMAWKLTAEVADLPEAHERLDAWLGDQLDRADVVLVKDPRLSWFLPLWTAVARQRGVEPAFVTMLRPPPEVVGSKRTYYNARLLDGQGVAAWVNMMLGTERATRDSSRVLVRYHDLLQAWEHVVTSIGKELELAPLTGIDEHTRAEVAGFVDPGLRRISLTWDELDLPERLATLARSAWTSLDELATADSHGGPELRARLDELSDLYEAYYLESEAVTQSSVLAARADERRRTAAGAPPITGRMALLALAVAVARRLPGWVRRLAPASTRARVRGQLRGRRVE
jgi:hypothetical protein